MSITIFFISVLAFDGRTDHQVVKVGMTNKVHAPRFLLVAKCRAIQDIWMNSHVISSMTTAIIMLLLGTWKQKHVWQISVLNAAVSWNSILSAKISSARAADCLLQGKKSTNYATRRKINLWIRKGEHMILIWNGGKPQRRINKKQCVKR